MRRYYKLTGNFIAILMLVFVGCDRTEPTIDAKTFQLEQRYWVAIHLQVMVIDSCEYLYTYTGGHTGYIFTHKGNCKFCAIRNKK